MLAVIAMYASVAQAASTPAASQDNDLVRDAVRKMYEVGSSPVQSPIIAKIFTASFYKVTSQIKGNGMANNMVVARNGDSVVALEETTTNGPMPLLLSVVKKDFRITNDEDAALFENALDRLYPLSEWGGSKDDKVKEVRRTKETVTFIRGAFFNERKGFILTLGADGAITGISYSLKIKP